MKHKSFLLVCMAMVMPVAAHAQYQMLQPSLYLGPQISYQAHVAAQEQGRQARRQAQAQAQGAAKASPRGATGASAARATAPVDIASLTYRPNLERRRANLAGFVDRTRAVDPAGAKDMAAMFAQNDVIAMIDKDLRKQNLRADNVADAYSVWWISAWQATRGLTDDVSPATVNAVREQAARALGATGQFAKANDAAKQEMAESLLIQAAMAEVAVEQAQGDSARLRQVATAVNQGAKGMGLDLMTMELGEKGFTPIKGS